jgi:hypothetical protein
VEISSAVMASREGGPEHSRQRGNFLTERPLALRCAGWESTSEESARLALEEAIKRAGNLNSQICAETAECIIERATLMKRRQGSPHGAKQNGVSCDSRVLELGRHPAKRCSAHMSRVVHDLDSGLPEMDLR